MRRSGGDVAGYIKRADEQVRLCAELAGLNSNTDILDIGCGDGRFPSALVPILKEGTYTTFEVQRRYVDYLTRTIGKKRPNFTFIHADLRHSYYNPNGSWPTEQFEFPFDSDRFDIVYLNSIFSHFVPVEIDHYLNEIQRVLKPGGIAWATYHIADAEALELDRQGKSAETLRLGRERLLNFEFKNHWTRDQDVQEKVVAVDENWLMNSYAASGLEVSRIIRGSWCGRPGPNYGLQQDLVLATAH